MTTNDESIRWGEIEFIPVETTDPRAPRPGRTPRIITIGAAAIIAVGALAAVFPKSGNEPAQPPRAIQTAERQLSERELLEDLVNRGLVPRQALEPARLSEREMLEDLVNRGLVPREALEPARLAEREILEDLVNRGLVPREALEPASQSEDR